MEKKTRGFFGSSQSIQRIFWSVSIDFILLLYVILIVQKKMSRKQINKGKQWENSCLDNWLALPFVTANPQDLVFRFVVEDIVPCWMTLKKLLHANTFLLTSELQKGGKTTRAGTICKRLCVFGRKFVAELHHNCKHTCVEIIHTHTHTHTLQEFSVYFSYMVDSYMYIEFTR